MTLRLVNLGISDKGNGDPIRVAFEKVNLNFIDITDQIQGIQSISGEQGVQGVQGVQGLQGVQGFPGTTLVTLEIDGGSASTDYTAEIIIDGGEA
ncbi:MAG: hypothetical protein EBT86_08180 [Actinobacteria bacterium]|nr:hypothetical protein [Actinomycetota bacterium]